MKRLLIVAAALFAAIAGGVAYAAIPGADGVINGCYQKNEGLLRVIDLATDACHPSENPLAWNVQGPKGDKGDKGEKGDKGDPGEQGPAGETLQYTAGIGLDLLETPPPFEAHVFGISQSHRLPQGCSGGQVPQKAGSGAGWVCGGGSGSPADNHVYVARGLGEIPVQGEFLIVSLTLPAGSYLISGRGDLITSDLDEQPAHCTLFTGDLNAGTAIPLDTSGTWLHEGGEPVRQPITVTAAHAFDEQAEVELRCGTYQGSGSGVLTAIRVGGIN